MAGKFYDGSDLPAAARLAGGAVEGDGSLFDTELWKVVDGARHLYDAWFYMSDSGTFFRAGTTEDVAMVIQCGLECEDPALRAQLGPAMVEARLLPTARPRRTPSSRRRWSGSSREGGGEAGTGAPAKRARRRRRRSRRRPRRRSRAAKKARGEEGGSEEGAGEEGGGEEAGREEGGRRRSRPRRSRAPKKSAKKPAKRR